VVAVSLRNALAGTKGGLRFAAIKAVFDKLGLVRAEHLGVSH